MLITGLSFHFYFFFLIPFMFFFSYSYVTNNTFKRFQRSIPLFFSFVYLNWSYINVEGLSFPFYYFPFISYEFSYSYAYNKLQEIAKEFSSLFTSYVSFHWSSTKITVAVFFSFSLIFFCLVWLLFLLCLQQVSKDFKRIYFLYFFICIPLVQHKDIRKELNTVCPLSSFAFYNIYMKEERETLARISNNLTTLPLPHSSAVPKTELFPRPILHVTHILFMRKRRCLKNVLEYNFFLLQ